MKKASWLVVLLGVVVLVVVPIIASAQEVQHAVVIKDEAIVFLDIDNNTLSEVPGTIKVVTNSNNCNKNVSAHGQYPFMPPSKSTIVDKIESGLDCLVYFDNVPFYTSDWHQVITPKGIVTLTCHFKTKGCGECPPETPYPLPGGGCCAWEPTNGECTF